MINRPLILDTEMIKLGSISKQEFYLDLYKYTSMGMCTTLTHFEKCAGMLSRLISDMAHNLVSRNTMPIGAVTPQ